MVASSLPVLGFTSLSFAKHITTLQANFLTGTLWKLLWCCRHFRKWFEVTQLPCKTSTTLCSKETLVFFTLLIVYVGLFSRHVFCNKYITLMFFKRDRVSLCSFSLQRKCRFQTKTFKSDVSPRQLLLVLHAFFRTSSSAISNLKIKHTCCSVLYFDNNCQAI